MHGVAAMILGGLVAQARAQDGLVDEMVDHFYGRAASLLPGLDSTRMAGLENTTLGKQGKLSTSSSRITDMSVYSHLGQGGHARILRPPSASLARSSPSSALSRPAGAAVAGAGGPLGGSHYEFRGIRMEPVMRGLRSEAIVRAVRDPANREWINADRALTFAATEEHDQPLLGRTGLLTRCHRRMSQQCPASGTAGSDTPPLEDDGPKDFESIACTSALREATKHALSRAPTAHRTVPRSRTMVLASKEDKDSSVRQLLGVKGASQTDNIWKIRLQLTKPVTWVPLIWGVVCGAAASGNYHAIWSGAPLEVCIEDAAKSFGCMVLSGPLLTGYTQTINDWYDRDIDAINEPYRPIPSGAISEGQVIAQIWALLLGGLGLAYALDGWAGHEFPTITSIAIGGSFVSYIYSAPPLKLKQSGWIGNYALGSSYIALPWWCGQAMFGTLNTPVIVLSILYSFAGLGIAIVNDFKSIEGDRAMGLMSLPVQFGVDKAKWICAGTIDITQLGVAAYLFSIGETTYASILVGLILPQMYLQNKFLLKDPIKYDVNYQAAAQPFLVFGILNTALAMGHHQF